MKTSKASLALLVASALLALVGKNAAESRFAKTKTPSMSLKPIDASYQAESMKLYNLGFPNAFADLIWVDLLQRAEITPVPNDQVSWEYTQLDGITTLDPNFDR